LYKITEQSALLDIVLQQCVHWEVSSTSRVFCRQRTTKSSSIDLSTVAHSSLTQSRAGLTQLHCYALCCLYVTTLCPVRLYCLPAYSPYRSAM